jgi:hypothetical protein
MTSEWILSQLTPIAPGFWLAFSLITLPVVLSLGRRLAPRRQRWLYAARWVLIPYAGLLLGGLSPRLMGLSKIDWATTLGLGAVLFFGLAALAFVVRIFMAAIDPAEKSSRDLLVSETRSGWAASVVLVLMIGAEQFHWSFIRGAIWELLLTWPQPVGGQPAYWAVWIATLIALPGVWLQPISVPYRFIKSALLVMTSIVFFYTRNFWLAWLLHVTAWFLLTQRIPKSVEDFECT